MARSFTDTLHRADEFFMKRSEVHDTVSRITRRLEEENIDYAIIGGMAMNAHGFERVTNDVDVLTTTEGLNAIHERLVGRGYVPTFPGSRKRLRDTQTNVTVDLITTGEYPGDGKPKAVRFPDPRDNSVERDGYRVITLPKLIELKLVSGLTGVNRLKDLGDVQELIKVLNLPRELGQQLDESVRDEYYKYWDAQKDAYDPSAG
jgi:hypothetical protein